jgi:3-hydroxyacyl-[acyl-carrier-protein] dehydratase
MTNTSQTVESGDIDVQEIMRRIPHRPPFLMIDRAEAYRPNQSLVGVKCVTINEPFFLGHFPGNPVMPGVLIIEALAQSAAILALAELKSEHQRMFMLTGIEKARFRRPVVPGDQLEMEVTVIRSRGPLWKMRAEARVGGEIAAEAELSAMEVPEEKLR